MAEVERDSNLGLMLVAGLGLVAAGVVLSKLGKGEKPKIGVSSLRVAYRVAK